MSIYSTQYTMQQSQELRNNIQHALTQQSVNVSTNNLNEADWWLLGTSGCHLCDQAQEMLRLFSGIYNVNYQSIDIADFDETLMLQFADKIPVLLTPSAGLCYPFTLADLQQLL